MLDGHEIQVGGHSDMINHFNVDFVIQSLQFLHQSTAWTKLSLIINILWYVMHFNTYSGDG